MAKFLKKFSAAQLRTAAGVEVDDKEFRKEMPALAEYLYATVDTDGRPRKTGTINIFVQEGRVKAFYTDKQNNVQVAATADGVLDVLRCLDEMLRGSDVPWREWQPQNGQQTPKKRS